MYNFFFLVLLNHALLPVTEVWDETPYFGSLFDYVVLGESKMYIKWGHEGGQNNGHKGRNDLDNLMPATRPEG